MSKDSRALQNQITELKSRLIEVETEIKILKEQKAEEESTCDNCGCHPTVIYQTTQGRFCENCKPRETRAFDSYRKQT